MCVYVRKYILQDCGQGPGTGISKGGQTGRTGCKRENPSRLPDYLLQSRHTKQVMRPDRAAIAQQRFFWGFLFFLALPPLAQDNKQRGDGSGYDTAAASPAAPCWRFDIFVSCCVSFHPFIEIGVCLCVYVPDGITQNKNLAMTWHTGCPKETIRKRL